MRRRWRTSHARGWLLPLHFYFTCCNFFLFIRRAGCSSFSECLFRIAGLLPMAQSGFVWVAAEKRPGSFFGPAARNTNLLCEEDHVLREKLDRTSFCRLACCVRRSVVAKGPHRAYELVHDGFLHHDCVEHDAPCMWDSQPCWFPSSSGRGAKVRRTRSQYYLIAS